MPDSIQSAHFHVCFPIHKTYQRKNGPGPSFHACGHFRFGDKPAAYYNLLIQLKLAELCKESFSWAHNLIAHQSNNKFIFQID